MELLQDFRVVIDKKEVLRYQGYKETLRLRDDISKILTNEIDEGYKLIKPKALYTRAGVVGIDDGVIELDNGSILNLGSAVADFRNSSYIVIAICTIGLALEERVSELIEVIDRTEFEADVIQQNCAKKVFEMEKRIDPISIFFLMRIIVELGSIADHAQDTGDRLRCIIAR